jgi:hypothetical protein
MTQRMTPQTRKRLMDHANRRGWSWSKFLKTYFPSAMTWTGPRLTEARGREIADRLDQRESSQ